MKRYTLTFVAVATLIVLGSCAVAEHQPTEPPRGALDTHAWETEIEQIETQVATFIETLENPAEATYVTEYKMLAVQVVESTPGGDTTWSLTFILTEDGWTLMNVLRVE